jgi:threonine dehydrogenase-like Zn-dependent dehydrogenase
MFRVDTVSDPAIEAPTDAIVRIPLEDAPRAYEMFQKKEDGAVKVLLQP